MIRRIHRAVLTLALVALAPPARADLVQDKVPNLFQKEAESLLPKTVRNALGVYRRTGKLIKTYGECVTAGGAQNECASWAVLCDLQSQDVSAWLRRSFGGFGRHGPIIASQLGLFDAFKTSTCGDDCFWCCLTPDGCHTSFGPSPVINCNLGYGAGTHTLGHTLITENPSGTNACLAIPQTCDLYSECRIAGNRGYPDGLPTPDSPYLPRPAPSYGHCTPRAAPVPITTCPLDPTWVPAGGNRVLEPRPGTSDELMDAIAARKIRYLTESLARKVQATLDGLPADYPQDELIDLVTMRGCVGHRHLLDFGEPFDGTHALFTQAIANPTVRDLVATRRGLHFIAMFRILGAIPNLYERLAFVESRLWTCQDRVDYLRTAGIEDPDGELLKTMSPLALGILKQVEGLQDYRLLAVPMPGEPPAPPRWYNGCELGAPPTVELDATSEGTEVVVRVTATDPDGVDAVQALPVQVDWGDGTTDEGSLPVATLTGSFRHTYRKAGAYTVVDAVAGQSGLRGLAGKVIEAAGGDPAAPLPVGFSRVALPSVRVQAGDQNAGNFDAGTIYGFMNHVGEGGTERIGRTPEKTIEIKRVDPMTMMVTNPGLTALGDLVGYNHDRVPGGHVELRFSRQGGTFWDGRNIHVLLKDVTVDVESPQRAERITRTVPLTPAMVKVFYVDMLATAEDVVTMDADGTLHVPLTAPRGPGRSPLLDRIDLDVSAVIAAIDLGDTDPDVLVGVGRHWREERPCDLVAGPIEGLPTPDAGIDAPAGAEDGGGGCGCRSSRSSAGGGVAALLVALALVRPRRRAL